MRRAAVFAVVLAACGGGITTSFRAIDPTFEARRSTQTPRVYLYRADVPEVPLRSVGLIVVSARASDGIDATIRAAAAKGQELGCWAVVDHDVFATMGSGSGALRRGPYHVAHGGHSGGEELQPVPVSRPTTTEFDCVVLAAP